MGIQVHLKQNEHFNCMWNTLVCFFANIFFFHQSAFSQVRCINFFHTILHLIQFHSFHLLSMLYKQKKTPHKKWRQMKAKTKKKLNVLTTHSINRDAFKFIIQFNCSAEFIYFRWFFVERDKSVEFFARATRLAEIEWKWFNVFIS